MNDETLKEQILDSSVTPEVAHDTSYLFIHIDKLMQLILQDRERAVREARIDELEIITDHYTPYRPFLDDDKNVNIRRYCTDRIAQLSNPTQEKEGK